MPTISVEQSLLKALLAKHGLTHDIGQMDLQLPLLGTDIDVCDDSNLTIEIFPDRPDLLSGETLARAMRNFLHGCKSEPGLDVKKGSITLSVDAELEHIRPIILGAVVRGVPLQKNEEQQDAFIKALMDHQEKLHFALGRGRKRASIGVHDLAQIKPPFRVKAVTGGTSFAPLGMEGELTIGEILTTHPKGVDYAHLLKDFSHYPIIVDSDDEVLSFPPIINGKQTTVSSSTTDFFIDVTGWDRRACESSLMLVALQLVERGGILESVEVETYDGKTEHHPISEPLEHQVTQRLLDGLLGRALSDSEIDSAINTS